MSASGRKQTVVNGYYSRCRISGEEESKKIDLGQTIGILANAGVIAGIVLLGMELRQNNELVVAN